MIFIWMSLVKQGAPSLSVPSASWHAICILCWTNISVRSTMISRCLSHVSVFLTYSVLENHFRSEPLGNGAQRNSGKLQYPFSWVSTKMDVSLFRKTVLDVDKIGRAKHKLVAGFWRFHHYRLVNRVNLNLITLRPHVPSDKGSNLISLAHTFRDLPIELLH